MKTAEITFAFSTKQVAMIIPQAYKQTQLILEHTLVHNPKTHKLSRSTETLTKSTNNTKTLLSHSDHKLWEHMHSFDTALTMPVEREIEKSYNNDKQSSFFSHDQGTKASWPWSRATRKYRLRRKSKRTYGRSGIGIQLVPATGWTETSNGS